ncbi:L-threonylcarbamoyladenylate synthase [Atopomonas sediminilitoris]|uniref:L-threonylcarbamoyladenylate synthase n=1 Tax=Atopomonas sediminilitoris TaxID=2919919 RepID=UPI001F4D9943|nr:L-threonylcarbamoyladenylate synthase [Atopomonas sediminilitoris]MCJ8169363.1 L-threonylcarbamoyladenylate synthase [Atopomonas sediminilitoris]
MPSSVVLSHAARIINAGGVVAYPCEAVWGLGCDPWDGEAVARLLLLKQRPAHKGLILVSGAIEDFAWLLHDLAQAKLSELRLSWPGPHTWLVPHQGRVPVWISGDSDCVALRVSAHPGIAALTALTGPLVSTSANIAGHPAARSRLRVEQYFHAALDAIVPGALGDAANPSMIRDLMTGATLRRA